MGIYLTALLVGVVCVVALAWLLGVLSAFLDKAKKPEGERTEKED